VRASRIEGRVVLAGIPDGDTAGAASRSSSRVGRRALVTHRERLKAVPELFEALAQSRPGYEKALLYPTEVMGTGRTDRFFSSILRATLWISGRRGSGRR
jgi:hypothetical protein